MRLINRYQDIDKKAWRQLVKESPTASFFQTETCFCFYETLSFLTPFVFALENGNLKGVIVGYIQKDPSILKHFFSRRAIILGGVLLAADITETELSCLLCECRRQLARKAIYIELRNYSDFSPWKQAFEKNGFQYIQHLNFHIDTSTDEVVMGNLGKSRKRDIRTSLRDGASVIECPTIDDVKAFFGILDNLYKTKVKTPLFPFEFFEKLYTSGLGIYVLIQLDNEVIGGTLCAGLEGKALYEWFACGKDGVYKNIYPSTLATFSGIQYAVAHGYPLFDMMGAGKPDDSYGVRDFKAKFGGKLVEHGRFLVIVKPMLYKIGKLAVKMMKR
jgi:hypothetical protein